MTDTGQVPGEGQPENAGMVEQPGMPAPGAYTFLDPSENTADDDDLLLMPGAQGAWTEPQPGVPTAPPVAVPMPQAAAQPGYDPFAQEAAVAYEPAVHETGAHETGAHEAGGRDSGSVDLGAVRFPQSAAGQAPQHARRPLHMGPPMPESTGGVVRSLADRGPAPMPVQGPPTTGPEYLDVPREEPASVRPAPQTAEVPPQGAEPWSQQSHESQQPQNPLAAPAETVVRDPAAPAQFVPVEGSVPTAPNLAPTPGSPEPAQAPEPAPRVPAPRDGATTEPQAPQAPEAGVDQAQQVQAAVQPTPPQGVPTPEQATVAPEPTPAPAQPTPAQPAPAQPTSAQPTPTPAQPTQAPEQAVPVPEQGAPAPAQATPAHGVPATEPTPQAPGQGVPAPEQGIPVPQAAAAEQTPTAPEQGAPAPEQAPAAEQVPAAPQQEAPGPERASGPEQVLPAQEPTVAPAPEPTTPEQMTQVPGQAAPAPAQGTTPEPVAPAAEPVAQARAVPVAGQPGPAPAQTTPAPEQAATPAQGTPVQEPAQPAAEPTEQAGHTADARPAEGPADGTGPAEAAPTDSAPTSAAPADQAQAGQAPVVAVPTAAAPDEQTAPAEQATAAAADATAPVDPAAGVAPADPAPAEQTTAEQAATEQAAADADPIAAAADPALAEQPPAGAEAAAAEAAALTAPAPAPEEAQPADGSDAGAPAPGYADDEREAILRVMRERRDIRNGFRSDPIPHEVLLRVLEAAHTAPSVGHSQPWDFVVIRSAETRRSMHELAQRQREAYANSLPKGRAKQFKELKIEAILDTPVNIVVTADPTRGGRHTLGRHTQPQMAPYSSALAVENLWLAARAEGLGVGWVSFFDEREMVRVLGLPDHLEVVAYLCVGYVDEFPDEPELMQAGWSKRRPLSWVVHEETYGRRALPGEEPHDLLQETVANIRPLDAKALGEAWERQKRMTKPAGALGMLEIISAQLSGLSRTCPPPVPEPAAVAIFAGDHGVHAQGVTAWPQEVTAQMVANFLGGGAVCNAFAHQVGAEVCVVDVGVAAELPATPGLLPRKVRPGTADFTAGPALTHEDVLSAIEVGIETARDLVAAGNKAVLTGEMGIANTTASAALISVFTGADPAEVTGRGTGINDEMHARKVDVVRRALDLHKPDPADPIGVLAAIGGLEHAAMVGFILGGASLRTPVILDGVSAGAAALVARAIAPESLAACIAGHRSAEPGHVAALNKLGLRPLVDLDLRLGEGTGALLALPLVQSAARAMHEVATFDSAGVTEK
ncbi:nicotinate-nucleotide--dimethylbenzimidazole phosphoribosyltransferase [Streptomyces sp. TRM49041]|uniref:nicotinate-nucleotide--dimethylbenzimidazole phosphoribosyltransferase n=1 Tax=Streptomyces sp. TRM49041 TaxID=2603216 RepID=UPI0011ED08F7|nr:nicotinate-nucleotide--dimethylbenzimidazole phosphoribosyltransferase [Streptomyces sp. TRM49041]